MVVVVDVVVVDVVVVEVVVVDDVVVVLEVVVLEVVVVSGGTSGGMHEVTRRAVPATATVATARRVRRPNLFD